VTGDENTKLSCAVWLQPAIVKFLYMFLLVVNHSELYKIYMFQTYILFAWVWVFFSSQGVFSM